MANNHYIVRINSSAGAQFGHVESVDPPVPGGQVIEVTEGPYETAEEAWFAHHWRQGHINV